MYNVSDRSIRNYRHKLNAGEPFHIFLKTHDDVIDIYVDRGGYASQRNQDTKNFDLSLGPADRVIDFIATGKTLPAPTPVWSAKDKTSEEALKPVAGYEVVSRLPSVEHSELINSPSLPEAEQQPEAEEREEQHSRGKRSVRGTALDMMKECKRLKDAGRTNEEIKQIMGFGHVSSVYDYLNKAKKAKL